MAELTPQERLQPSLLDRLTDNAPEEKKESRLDRVLSLRKLRECVMRDLAWLLNTTNLGTTEDLERYPEVENSVLNYGLPGLAGLTASGADVRQLEKQLKQSILNFEPRILGNSLRVRMILSDSEMNRNAMVIEIEGELWAQPVPLSLFLKTEIDLETGGVSVSEYAAREPT